MASSKKAAPSGEKAAPSGEETRAFVVTKGTVGHYNVGEVFCLTPAQIASGYDAKRLIAMGVVRPATPEDGEALPYGTIPGLLRPFPPVPFENVTARQATLVQEISYEQSNEDEAE